MKIFNSMTREKEAFTTLEPGIARIYVCGPTVYNFFHIGNARPFITFDTLRRYLEYRGLKVEYVQNFTDIDDKMINKANSEGITVRELADRYIAEYYIDADKLNIRRPTWQPRATDCIPEIIDLIATLVEKGHAYETEDGVYFDMASFQQYGELSHHNLDELEAGASDRVAIDENKRNPMDFVLWKKKKPNEPFWASPWGDGRPGWHIECSAMSRKFLGDTLDIHGGGKDLIFPHHENEIAQSEAAYGEKFVRHWIHAEHLLVNGSKMSKSLGNFYTLRDLLDKGHSPRSIRYLLVSAHYRKQYNFTLEGIGQADQALARIDNLIVRLRDVKKVGPLDPAIRDMADKMIADFTEAVDDDLNISRGLGVFFEFVHDVNTLINEDRITRTGCDAVLDTMKSLDAVLGVIFFDDPAAKAIDGSWVESMIAERIAAKKDKNFARADGIRKQLLEKGVVLEDTKEGTRWKTKN